MTTTTTPYYPQLAERDCGATCLRMVAEHFGVRMSMAYLREVTETTDVNQLTIEAWDKKSGTAEFKATAISVKPKVEIRA